MLTELEFRNMKHIVLDKLNCTYIMNKVEPGSAWALFEIEKDAVPVMVQSIGLLEDGAYEFYRERMASYGFKRFPIIEE